MKLTKKPINLPSKLEDLTKFVLIGREKLVSVRAEIRAINKLDLATVVREQKKEEATMLAGALLDAEVKIGDNCDISSFVAINAADSHKKCIGFSEEVERGKIVLENNVFVGSHSFIGGNVHIGHNSVVAAGTILTNSGYIPPYSLIIGNPAEIKENYYKNVK